MLSLRRAAERSIVAVHLAEDDAPHDEASRIEEISGVENPIKRAGLLAVHGLAVRHPRTLTTLLGINKESFRLAHIDSGFDSSVYKTSGNTVLKIDRRSEWDGLTRNEMEIRAAKLRYEHEALASCVGPTVLPHDITIGRNPRKVGSDVIRIEQPFRDVSFLNLAVEERQVGQLSTALEEVAKTRPELVNSLFGLIATNRRLYSDTGGLITDIIGRNNVGVDNNTDALVVVDAQPIAGETEGLRQLQITTHDFYFSNLELAVAPLLA